MKWWYLLLGVFGIYSLLVVLLNLFLDKVLFLPVKLVEDYTFQFDQNFEELWLKQGTTEVNALFFPTDSLPKGLVLYFHGNADNLQRWGRYVKELTQQNYEVLAIDYPGYGKSPGKPGEASVYRSAEMAWEWAENHTEVENIVIYGRSLGSGPACYLSARHKGRTLILETPFHSVHDVLRKRFPIGIWWNEEIRFPNHENLSKTQNEAFILQGTKDRIVPFSSAIRLRPLLLDEEHFTIFEGGTHHNLSTFPLFQERLSAILQ